MTKQQKVKFADKVITACIAASVSITAAVLIEYHRLNTVLPQGVISALLGFWGGELMLVALRQIFGSDVFKTPARRDGTDDSI